MISKRGADYAYTQTPIRLSWRGLESVDEILRKLAKPKPVMLTLPRSFHHVLCARLRDHAKLHDMLDISGDSDLLGRVAEIDGLHELAQLCKPVQFAGAAVWLRSPPPQVHLFFSKASSKRV